ncbi:hypothetical protein [Brucella sp. 2716]|uniref:hypothetical protein n=1 Tax=Brucella sp. 2716 TaxID=2975052 RepID=UPI00217DABC1|nr:hypothetical protein [Brucella sp. 2716]UWF60330.1 hypothetical protein NYO66_15175 [Brucella sp. 2716]
MLNNMPAQVPLSPYAWEQDWRDQTVVIVASGPSAKTAPLHLARDKARFITVNDSWRLAAWADVLYAADYSWWHLNNGCPEFSGTKMSVNIDSNRKRKWNIQCIPCDTGSNQILLRGSGKIGWGGGSGFGALNIAVQSGCRSILLVGYDFTLDFSSHWFGDYSEPLENPDQQKIVQWRGAVEAALPMITDAGITVINCSQISTLRYLPKVDFATAVKYIFD